MKPSSQASTSCFVRDALACGSVGVTAAMGSPGFGGGICAPSSAFAVAKKGIRATINVIAARVRMGSSFSRGPLSAVLCYPLRAIIVLIRESSTCLRYFVRDQLRAPRYRVPLESLPMSTAKTKQPVRPTLGGLLRSLRSRNGWTLKEMSKRTGIPLSTLAKVEHDRLTLTYDKLQQLSERLKIRMSDLFAESSSAP